MKKFKQLLVISLLFLLLGIPVYAGLTGPGSISSPTTPSALCKVDSDTWAFCNSASDTFGDSTVPVLNAYFTGATIDTLTVGDIVSGTMIIDVTDPKALLIRKNADAGDLAVFDTTNFDIGLFGGVEFSPTSVTSTAILVDQNFNHISIDIDSEATSATVLNIAAANTSGDLVKILNTSEMLALDYLGNLDVAQDVDVGDDLLLATAGVIDWNSADKLTHSANTMTVSGFTTWDMGAVATLDFDSNIAITTGTGDVDISGASLGVDVTEKLLLDGIAGHTYILESTANELSFFAGGLEGLRIDFNELEVQPLMTLATGPIELEADSGAVTLVNLPVSSTPADGDEESMTLAIDSNAVLKVYGEADGTGGADTFKVLTTGQITSSYTGSAGWSVIANTTPDTTTCIESCTFACLFGWDDTGATILDCSSTVPDKCVCMGAN